jgi:hypothetical protein
MNSDRAVVAGLHQCILKDDTDISRLDRLWGNSFSMCLENEVVTGKPFLEDTQQD